MVTLTNTIVTLECGPGLSAVYYIPLHLLCAQSQKQADIFKQAGDLRQHYSRMKALRQRVKDVTPLLGIWAPQSSVQGRSREWVRPSPYTPHPCTLATDQI